MSQRGGTKLVQTQKLRLTQSLTAAMRLLRFDASGLSRYLEEQAAENPAVRLVPADLPPDDWLPRWTGVFRTQGAYPADSGAEERVAGPAPSLTAHVMQAIAAMFPDPRARDRATVFAMALEPSGWLGQPLASLAVEARMTMPEAEALLRRLQGIEPTGLFARSLRECLALQVEDAGWLDPPMAVVLGNLDRVAAGDLAGLARRAGVPEAEIALRLRRLRGLNPKPGAQFDPGAAAVHEPDLTVARADGGWSVALNRAALPTVLVRDGAGDAAAARGLQRMLRARGEMLLRIAVEVVRRQAASLDRGPAALVPMGMAEVAETLGVHESTVSRAVSGVSMDTPRGTVWLRAMFSGAVGEGVAAAALRARLADLVAAEDAAAPMSDAALAARLTVAGGEPVARRTVAKYRAMLAIPAAHRRRRR
ncbi:MAG: RNA polymerase sigma-54 factor [Paracoccaceae bacterium]|nr:MAG: RNA polymerase sigma-54 factor [Paracoccaceae bacterium]